jgi:hypothetical protein
MKLRWVMSLVVVAVGLCPSARSESIIENFEGQTVGAFPGGWLDVGLVDPTPPNPPIPSAVVVNTTDAFGNPTRALATVAAIAPSQGIYQPITPQSIYRVSADVRIDRFSNNSLGDVLDGVQVGFALAGPSPGVDFAFIPSVGIYSASLSQAWRLYVVTENVVQPEFDLGPGSAVTLGTWYGIDLEIFADTGTIHSRIRELATGTVLVDRFDTFAGWVPSQDGVFDVLEFLDIELSPGTTISNLAVVDNIVAEVGVPEPATLTLFGLGALSVLGSRWWRRQRSR